jgi:hypothetical protein
VFLDKDGDGKVDGGEAVAVTNVRGQYAFASVGAGSVRVRLLLAGSVPTAPSGGLYTLAVKDGQILNGRNFGVR